MRKKILIVDDNPDIHEDFKLALLNQSSDADLDLKSLEDDLLNDGETSNDPPSSTYSSYDLHHAYQGEEALAMIEAAEAESKPYSLVFLDIRMPPGIDGIQTLKKEGTEGK